ncbi:hypothetical protein [Flavobacterium soyangense]|uniref:hypothetical protein n=1 Tax=Flavobacterium soyangense TaxID=2023265 RepID=UPI00293BC39F|nr:hypothetical protein [Flavobacterium soyangense]
MNILFGIIPEFFSKIELFGLEGIALSIGKLVLTFAVAYALLGNFSTKIKTVLVFSVLGILLFLAYSRWTCFSNSRINMEYCVSYKQITLD